MQCAHILAIDKNVNQMTAQQQRLELHILLRQEVEGRNPHMSPPPHAWNASSMTNTYVLHDRLLFILLFRVFYHEEMNVGRKRALD